MSTDLQFSNNTATYAYSLGDMGDLYTKRVLQSADQAGGHIYSLHVTGSGSNETAVIQKHGADGGRAIAKIVCSSGGAEKIGHQGLSYEKTVDGKHIFWSSKKGDQDSVVRFELSEDSQGNLHIGNVEEFKIWQGGEGSGSSASPTISADGQYLIVEKVGLYSGEIAVYKLDGFNENSQPEYRFPLDESLTSQNKNYFQAVASDGEYVYMVTGAGGSKDPKKIAKYTIDGEIVGISDFTIGQDTSGANRHFEPEGLFFTEDGKLAVLVAMGSLGFRVNKVFYIGDTLGTENNDIIQGDSRDNHLYGYEGDDELHGGAGHDKLYGGDGDDYLRDDAGRDLFDGGKGVDTASYYGRSSGITVNLATGDNSDGDTYVSIENIEGSNRGNDHLTGDAGDNILWGLGGDDRLYGGAGNDKLYGGDGNDYLRDDAGSDLFDGGKGIDKVSYYGRSLGVIANLATGYNNDGDIYISIEELMGSNTGNDHLTGDDGNNGLWGLGGDDKLYGGAGYDRLYGGDGNDFLEGGYGHDLLSGGKGQDTVSYASHKEAITANLTTRVNSDGDIYDSIENLMGSDRGNDHLTGSSGDNILWGLGGDDRLYGGSGNDKLYGGAGNDYLRDDAGRDLFDGGEGQDTASYYGRRSGITANLETGYNNDGDIYISIENLMGSNRGGDRLTGCSGDNELWGMGGHDRLYGGAGNDKLYGGSGNDWLYTGSGTDELYGGSGRDYFVLEAGQNGGVIKDFENNRDTIYITAKASETHFTEMDGDVLIRYGSSTMTVEDTSIAYLQNDLLFI